MRDESTPAETIAAAIEKLDAADTMRQSDLIVLLHRTIDAQLAILRAAQSAHRGFVGGALTRTERAALDLARAILGEQQ